MLDQNELYDLSVLFEVGFLCDRVVRSILNSSFGLMPLGREIIEDALTFLKIVRSFRENFPPKTFDEAKPIYLAIYRLALLAYSGLNEKSFTIEISAMIEKLESLEKNTSQDLIGIANFFNKISKKTLEESSKFFKKFEPPNEFINAEKIIEFVIEKILSQNRLLTRLRSEEFPTDAQEKAILLLLKIGSILYTKLFSLLEELKSAHKLPFENREQLSKVIEITAKRYDYITELILVIIKLIESSCIRNYPLGIFFTLENVLNLFQKNVLLIVTVSNENSFSYINLLDVLKDLLKNALEKAEVKKLEEECPQCILLFNHPVFDKDNVLLHCLIANPLGNYLIDCHGLLEKIMKKEVFSKLLLNLPNNFNSKEDELERVSLVEQTLKKIKNWIISISSDLLAIHTFGPSYLFAFFKHIFYTGTYKFTAPLKNRLKVMLEEIKNLEYTKNIQISKEIEKFEKHIEDEAGCTNSELTITFIIPKIKEEIRKLTIGKQYTLQIFEEEVPFLISLILNFIPPNEILDFRNKTSRPANIISILNAGWLLTTTQIDKVYQMLNAKTLEEKSQVNIKLNRLIQKAIELSEIHRKMREA